MHTYDTYIRGRYAGEVTGANETRALNKAMRRHAIRKPADIKVVRRTPPDSLQPIANDTETQTTQD